MNKSESHSDLPERIRPLFSPSLYEKLLALRHELHRHPELAFQEERTASRLYDELAALNPVEVRRVAGTGVIARIAGRQSGAKVVALRGDIDALPIQEATGLSYTSQNDGIMHACGHDVHASWIVGAACLLSENPAWGDVLIVLQPAEESGQGAVKVLESSALDSVSAIFGGHVDRRFEMGCVVAQPGPMGASTDSFEIDLLGSPGHGARPHEAVDPVVGLGALIMALQTIVSRKIDPASPAVVSIGRVAGGSAPNIIPAKVSMAGTLRAVHPKTRRLLMEEVQKITKSTAAAYNLKVDIRFGNGTPPVINHPEPACWARNATESLLGEGAVVPMGYQNMGGEDFAYYLEKIPGAFLRIGACEPGGEPIAAHSPHFYVPDETVFLGAALMAEVARVASDAING